MNDEDAVAVTGEQWEGAAGDEVWFINGVEVGPTLIGQTIRPGDVVVARRPNWVPPCGACGGHGTVSYVGSGPYRYECRTCGGCGLTANEEGR